MKEYTSVLQWQGSKDRGIGHHKYLLTMYFKNKGGLKVGPTAGISVEVGHSMTDTLILNSGAFMVKQALIRAVTPAEDLLLWLAAPGYNKPAALRW